MRFSTILFALCGTFVLATPFIRSDNIQSIGARAAEALDVDLSISTGPVVSDAPRAPAPVPSISNLPKLPTLEELIPDELEEIFEQFADIEVPGVVVPSLSVPAISSPTVTARPSRFLLPANITANSTLNGFTNDTMTNTTSGSMPAPMPSFSSTKPPSSMSVIDLGTSPSLQPISAAVPSDVAEAIRDGFETPSKIKRDPEAAAEALNIKLPSIMPQIPKMPGMPGTAGAACNTNNTQVNQCSSGIPYCCSPDGAGGQTCQNGNVQCQQTVICCNNFNGFQFCMGDMDFNIPITINLNLGDGGKGGKKNKGE